MLEFRLYVVKSAPTGVEAAYYVKKMLDTYCRGRHTLEVIDVFEEPAAAENDRIIATPTLLKVAPEPKKRLVGDLSNMESVKILLEL